MKSIELLQFGFLFACLYLCLGCQITHHTMKSPDYHIEFYKGDFDYSKQVAAEATVTRVFMIDWKRLFSWQSARITSDEVPVSEQHINLNGNVLLEDLAGGFSIPVIPVIGEVDKGRASAYALYNLMQENPGYDLVIYPQFSSKSFVIPVFYSKKTVMVKARLAKIKDE